MTTNMGAAMAGGNPANGRKKNDFYPTPDNVTQALLNNFNFKDVIFEPAAGDGAMVKVLQRNGKRVIAADLEPRHPKIHELDFLKLNKLPAKTIITNPPFNIAEKFIRHAMELGVEEMALVLKSTYFHAKTRYPLFKEYQPSAVCPLLWRPDFLGLGRPTMEVAWFIWEKSDGVEDTRYIPLIKP